MIIKNEDIVGYMFGDSYTSGDTVCTECVTDEERDSATAEEILTEKDLERIQDKDQEVYCDRCNMKLPVSPEVEKPKKIKRRWWVNLGIWEAKFEDAEVEKRALEVAERIHALNPDITEAENGQLVFKTWDEDQATSVFANAMGIVRMYGFDDSVIDSMDMTAQPQCPKCEALGKFSSTYCDNCGTALLR